MWWCFFLFLVPHCYSLSSFFSLISKMIKWATWVLMLYCWHNRMLCSSFFQIRYMVLIMMNDKHISHRLPSHFFLEEKLDICIMFFCFLLIWELVTTRGKSSGYICVIYISSRVLFSSYLGFLSAILYDFISDFSLINKLREGRRKMFSCQPVLVWCRI